MHTHAVPGHRAMPAAIATIHNPDWHPACPATWYMWKGEKHIQIKFGQEQGVTEHHVKYVARQTREQQAWDRASEQFSSKGLEGGIPDLQAISNAKNKLHVAGLYGQANIIDRIASGSMWSGERLVTTYNSYRTAHPNDHGTTLLGRTTKHIDTGITQHQIILELCRCPRCGAPNETFHHRYYDCPHNHHITDHCDDDGRHTYDSDQQEAIDDIMHRTHALTNTIENYNNYPCYQYRGIIPHVLLT